MQGWGYLIKYTKGENENQSANIGGQKEREREREHTMETVTNH